jgi:putative sigma-54 modulation protein
LNPELEELMPNKVEVQTRNIRLTDEIEEYVNKKAGNLDHYLPAIEDARVELSHYKAARDANDRNVQRQIERHKGKHYHGRGDGRSAAEVADEIRDGETGELSPLVARRKKFVLYPMDEEEAVVQMRNLGHDNFFVFYNATTSSINVLYRRRNGSYGLIEPVLG